VIRLRLKERKRSNQKKRQEKFETKEEVDKKWPGLLAFVSLCIPVFLTLTIRKLKETYAMLCVAVCGRKEFDVVIGTVPRDQYC
jgi:hypothetical protein